MRQFFLQQLFSSILFRLEIGFLPSNLLRLDDVLEIKLSRISYRLMSIVYDEIEQAGSILLYCSYTRIDLSTREELGEFDA